MKKLILIFGEVNFIFFPLFSSSRSPSQEAYQDHLRPLDYYCVINSN